MTQPRVSTDVTIEDRVASARAAIVAEGVSISAWARANGFNPKTVHTVLTGTRKCNFGQGHRIAVALGIKDAPRGSQPLARAA